MKSPKHLSWAWKVPKFDVHRSGPEVFEWKPASHFSVIAWNLDLFGMSYEGYTPFIWPYFFKKHFRKTRHLNEKNTVCLTLASAYRSMISDDLRSHIPVMSPRRVGILGPETILTGSCMVRHVRRCKRPPWAWHCRAKRNCPACRVGS